MGEVNRVNVFDEIQSLCRDFRKRLKAGQSASIDEYLPRIDDSARDTLFQNLLHLDIEFRRKGGKTSSSEDYMRELGRGGFGVVYEARHLQRGDRVALKTLPMNLDGQPESTRDVPLHEIIDRKLTRLPEESTELLRVIAIAGQAISLEETSLVVGHETPLYSTITHRRSERLVRLIGSTDQQWWLPNSIWRRANGNMKPLRRIPIPPDFRITNGCGSLVFLGHHDFVADADGSARFSGLHDTQSLKQSRWKRRRQEVVDSRPLLSVLTIMSEVNSHEGGGESH